MDIKADKIATSPSGKCDGELCTSRVPLRYTVFTEEWVETGFRNFLFFFFLFFWILSLFIFAPMIYGTEEDKAVWQTFGAKHFPLLPPLPRSFRILSLNCYTRCFHANSNQFVVTRRWSPSRDGLIGLISFFFAMFRNAYRVFRRRIDEESRWNSLKSLFERLKNA